MLTIVILSALALGATALVWVGAVYLERAGNALAIYYGVPAIVQGAVVVAVGSSMPELVTVILAPVIHGDFDLGLAAIVGSAIFNILVIPALATLATRDHLDASRDIVYKEAQFYLIAVAVFLLMLSLAVIYYPSGRTEFGGTITPWLALGPLALYVLYTFIQYQDTVEHVPTRDATGIRVRRAWLEFGAGFLLILIGVDGLLRAAIGFGTAFDTPSFVWGLTIIAAATSLPDTFVSVRAATADRTVTGIANVFGSNVFDLLVVIPIGVLVVGAQVIDFAQLAPLVGFLILATVVLFAELRTDFALTRLEAYSLLGLYGLFLGWVILSAFGHISGPI